ADSVLCGNRKSLLRLSTGAVCSFQGTPYLGLGLLDPLAKVGCRAIIRWFQATDKTSLRLLRNNLIDNIVEPLARVGELFRTGAPQGPRSLLCMGGNIGHAACRLAPLALCCRSSFRAKSKQGGMQPPQ